MVNRRHSPSDKQEEEEEDHVVGDHSMDLHELDEDDDLTVTSHGTPPSRKESHFEFTNGQGIMQIARLWITLQVMALVCDNPSTQLPIVFRILCRGALYYAGRFHPRPFVDFVYVIQWAIAKYAQPYLDTMPSNPSSVEVEDPSAAAPGVPGVDTPDAPGGNAPGGVGRRMLRGSMNYYFQNVLVLYIMVVLVQHIQHYYVLLHH